jgi:hypothetical protein
MATNRFYKKRVWRGSISHLSEVRKNELLSGFVFPTDEGYFESEEEAKTAWFTWREKLLAEWITTRPGTRPDAWWRFEHPGKKLKTVGQASCWDSMGKFIIYDIREEEFDYLRRNDLLMPNEQPPDHYELRWQTKKNLMAMHEENIELEK